MWTTRSISSRPCASLSFSRSRGARDGPRLLLMDFFPIHNSQLTTHNSQFTISLELQASLAGGIGQGPDLAVVDVASPIEDHPGDSLFLCPLGHKRADLRGRRNVGSGLAFLPDSGVQRRGGRQGPAVRVVDDLSVDV